MPAQNLLRHWMDETVTFQQNLALLRKHISEDAIHDLRVSVKKLRSYAKFLHHLPNIRLTQNLRATEELFLILGKQRNIVVSKELTVATLKNKAMAGSFVLYLHQLLEQSNKYCEAAIRNYQDKVLNEFTAGLAKRFANCPEDRVLKEAKARVDSSLKEIRPQLKTFSKEYHLVRKKLKDIFYWSAVFPSILSDSDTKQIDKALDCLGSAQDHAILVSNFKTFRKMLLANKSKDSELIRKSEEKASAKQKQFLEKALEIIRNLVLHLS